MNGETDRKDAGLLLLRLGIGVMFIYHGWPKLMGGTETWHGLGQAMGNLGIAFAPTFWGFMAAAAEFFGGIALIVGAPFRFFCAIAAFDMFVAALFHLKAGQGLGQASHAIELMIVFVSLLVMGAGRYSLSAKSRLSWLK
jgi:putative oxidoreductase